MTLLEVTEDQFQSTGLRTVQHVPTGGSYSTHDYETLPLSIRLIASNCKTRDKAGDSYSPNDIDQAARWLLMRKLKEQGIKP